MISTRLVLLFLTSCLASISVQANNDYPVVLVHGFAGWARDEMLGFKYWGELQGDLQEQLNAQGYKVLTAAVGPFSSNWDRAVELYYQIKGGQVDYGKNHSSTHGHSQTGRVVKQGLYPEWGTKDANGNTRKIHLVGHSMGGQTIRMLAQLLAHGSKGAPIEEDAATSSELFKGGHEDYIHSITTISTPNQGTLLADGASGFGNLLETMVGGVLGVVGLAGGNSKLLYDAKLDQWGVGAKQPGDSLKSYLNRVFASKLFKPGFKDICLWSLSTAGAKEESTWVQTLPSIYYFSYSAHDTFAAKNIRRQDIQLPNVLTMLPPLDPLATFLGSRYAPDHGFGESWQPNDGVVNTESMISDGRGEIVKYQGTAYRGKWNRMPTLNRLDHEAVVGLTLHTKVFKVYLNHMDLLRRLPINGEEAAVLEADRLMEAANNDVYDLDSVPINTIDDLKTLCAAASATSPYVQAYCEALIAQANAASNNTTVAPAS